jgi:hypothetical protein
MVKDSRQAEEKTNLRQSRKAAKPQSRKAAKKAVDYVPSKASLFSFFFAALRLCVRFFF